MCPNRPRPTPLREDKIAALRDYLVSFDLFAGIEAEGIGYLDNSMRRFLITLEMVPPAADPPSELLELGANPYFLTLMLMRYRNYRITAANYFGDEGPTDGRGEQVITSVKYSERHRFVYDHFNVEKEPFPYSDGQFDLVLCCEILEHLSLDPTQMLYEIHRVLKPGGRLILTTPNVLAYQNLWKLATGKNIYDQYSGYGVYGRHNREYTPLEVTHLLQACGFELVEVHLEDILAHPPLTQLLKRFRKHWRDNIFILAQAQDRSRYGYPPFLYRSLHRLRHVVSSEIVMGENDEAQLGRGWYPVEWGPWPARWMGQEARAYLAHRDDQDCLRLELDPMVASLGPTTLTLKVGAATEQFHLNADGWQRVEMRLSTNLPEKVEVYFTVHPTRNPARLGLSADDRELGVLINRLWLD